MPFDSSEIAQDEILLLVRLNYSGEYQRKGQNRSEKKYRRNKTRAKLGIESDFTINIRFLSAYFRGEVDILAGLCYNRYPRKATKYEKLNDKKRFRLISSRNPFFIAYSILQKVKAISVLLSSRNNLCIQKTRTRSNFPGAYFSFCGGAKGTRTPDLCVANASLYQLSYNPTGRVTIKLPRFTQPLLPTDYKTRRFYVSRCRPQINFHCHAM